MRITSIRLENFRSYKEKMAIESLPQVTVLIGPNNSGKSNIIQVLLTYQTMSRGQMLRPLSEWFHTGNRSNPLRLEFEFELDDDDRQSILDMLQFRSPEIEASMKSSQFIRRVKHEIQFDSDGLHNELLAVSNFSGEWLPIFGWSFEKTESQFWRSGLSKLAQELPSARDLTAGERQVISKADGKRGIAFEWPLEARSVEMRLNGLLRSYVQRGYWIPPIRRSLPRINPGQDMLVQPEGENLVRVLNTIQTEDPDRYVSLTKEIYKIVPGLDRITAPPRGAEVTAIIREPGGVEVELRDASSGLQQALILITSLSTYPKNSLVLIEEPEIHLHASSQRALFRLIKQLAQDKGHQFIITTHSTIFTEVSPKTCTYLIDKRDGTSRVRQLKEQPELHYLKHVLGHENTDLFGFNGVVIIEGDTEDVALPILAEPLGVDLAQLGVKLHNIRGAGKTARIEQLLQFLKDSDTIPFLMLDGQSDVQRRVKDWVGLNLVRQENVFIWEKEFEDCFDNTTIAKAFKAWAQNEGITLTLNEGELSEARQAGKKVSDFLNKLVFEQTGRSLSKPAFGEKIAQIVVESKPRAELTKPEEVLKSIADRIRQ